MLLLVDVAKDKMMVRNVNCIYFNKRNLRCRNNKMIEKSFLRRLLGIVCVEYNSIGVCCDNVERYKRATLPKINCSPKMSGANDDKTIHLFKWEELDGKSLNIKVGVDDAPEGDTTTICVMGYEKKTGKHYVLHTERTIKKMGENETS